MPLDMTIIETISHPRFNPPAIVEELRALPHATVTQAFVRTIAIELAAAQEARGSSLAGLSQLMENESFKDDGQEFGEVIAGFDAHVVEIGKKLISLERALKRAQRNDGARDRNLDEQLLELARQDYDDRIDVAMYWRAQQARIWPSSVSRQFDDPEELAKALRRSTA